MKTYLENPTSRAFILSNVISCPFFGIFALLPMILCKELDASPFQISTMTALKPLTALFASYWGSSVLGKQPRLSLMWAYFLKFLPFVIAPFFSNPWMMISAFGMHMLLLRGVIPSWMELLKQNLSGCDRGKVCAAGSTINYLCTALMPLLFGWMLDVFQGSWQWILLYTSLLGMCSVLLIRKVMQSSIEGSGNEKIRSMKRFVLYPWKSTKNLLQKRPDFFQFQAGFFFGGAGLMTIHAVIPKYFTEHLQLSYTGMFLAVCFCKGLGFVIATPLWVKLFNRSEIFSFCARIPLIAVLLPLLLMLAYFNPSFVFIAYLLYGVMQAGSELGWKMSGPVFAGADNSTPYSSTNILAVGIRGAIFPYLGAGLFIFGGPYLVFVIGGLSCLAGSIQLWRYRERYAIRIT